MATRNYNKKGVQRRSLPYYSRTSEAFAVDPVQPEELRPRRRPLPRRAKIVRYKLVNEGKKISLLAMLTVILIFSGLLSVASFFTMISEKQSEISGLSNLHKKLQEANLITQAQIAQGCDLKEIEQIAIGRLGMDRPKPHQIAYITVPKQDYVVMKSK